MEIKLRKQPHLQQQKFIDCDMPEQLYGGAKRGGKSVALVQKIILLSVFFPGNRILLGRLNQSDLVVTTLDEFFKVCPPELILEHHKGDRRVMVQSIDPHVPSEILYRGLGDPDDFEKIKSLTIAVLAIDEPSEVPYPTYLMLRAQLTHQLPISTQYPHGGRPPYMTLLASNPEPGWVEDRFVTDPQPGCAFIPALPSDNPFLPDNYVSTLVATYPREWVDKYVRGIWGASEGAIFKELDEEIHNLDNWLPAANAEDQTKWWEWCWGLELFGALDHGSTGITAYAITATDVADNKFVLAEHYEQNLLVSQHSDIIKGLKSHYLRRRTNGVELSKEFSYELIDPSCFQKTQQGGGSSTEGMRTVGSAGLQSIADLYYEQGMKFIPAWNALELGLERVKEFLHPIPSHRHPFTGAMCAPALYMSKSRCPNVWKDMRGLRKRITPAGSVQITGRDHGADIVRYWVNSQPRRAEIIKAELMAGNSLDALAMRSHEQWARKFVNSDDGTWWSGTGMIVRPYGGGVGSGGRVGRGRGRGVV